MEQEVGGLTAARPPVLSSPHAPSSLQRRGIKAALSAPGLLPAYSPSQPLSEASWPPSVLMMSAAASLTASPAGTTAALSLPDFPSGCSRLQPSSISSTSCSPVCVRRVSFLPLWEPGCQELISPGGGTDAALSSLHPSGAFSHFWWGNDAFSSASTMESEAVNSGFRHYHQTQLR